METKSIKKINDFLLLILLAFGLFDTARNYTKLPLAFGYLKDFAIYALFLINIRKIVLPKFLGKSFYVFAIIILVITPLGALNTNYSTLNILIAWAKYFEIVLFMILFANWSSIFGIKFEKFIKFYILGSLILCAVNVFGYYFDNPIVSNKLANENMPLGNYGGRVTVGQPPVAIFPVIISFVYLMVYAKKFKSRILMLVFWICILLATSNTGILAILFVFMFLTAYALLKMDKTVKTNLKIIFIFSLFALCVVLLINSKFVVDLLDKYLNKIGKYFSADTDPSMDIRHDHWNLGLSTMNELNYIFGRGAYGYIIDEFYPIENTFVSTFLMYGVIGLVALIAFVLYQIIAIVKAYIKTKDKKYILLLCVWCVFIFHMYTLDIYSCYTLYFALSVFTVCSYQYKEKDKFLKRKIALNPGRAKIETGLKHV